MPVVAVLAGGPDWTSIMTAFGTVAAAVAAVSIALLADRRADGRIRAEHDRSDAQLADERRLAREREQLAEAYSVQVVMAQRLIREARNPTESPLFRLSVMVVNRGRFTVTRLEARFSYDGRSVSAAAGYDRAPAVPDPPDVTPGGQLPVEGALFGVLRGWDAGILPAEGAMFGVLCPWDAGIRFDSNEVAGRSFKGPYPLVRWVDRWGTRWEHRLGEVRQVADGQEWAP